MAHVRHEISVEVVAIQRRPERVVARAAEVAIQDAELLNRFAEGRVAHRGVGVRGGEAGGEGREDVRGHEGEGKGEVRGGEDGEGLDEDVGDGFVAGEVRVELVAAVYGGF